MTRRMICLTIAAVLLIAITSTSLAGDAWSIEEPFDNIPDKPLVGKIFGKDFEIGEATISGHALTLKSKNKSQGWPEGKVIIFIGMDDKESEWTVTPKNEGMLPHVHMMFAQEGQEGHQVPATIMYVGQYSMHLVFTEKTDEYVKGKLHLSMPDYKKSYLIGSFTAKVI